jgi:hypothetical protein
MGNILGADSDLLRDLSVFQTLIAQLPDLLFAVIWFLHFFDPPVQSAAFLCRAGIFSFGNAC